MAEFIANEDYEIEITPLGPWSPGDPSSSLEMTFIETKSTKLKLSNKKAMTQSLSWAVTTGTCSLSNYTHAGGGSVLIPTPPPIQPGLPIIATSTKCKSENKFCLRENDQGICNGVFTLNSSPFTPLTCSCIFKIKKAGQTKVKGN